MDSGRGVLEALWMEGESEVPKTLRMEPGAKPVLKLAPLATLVTAGVPVELDPEDATLRVTDALLALL
jgi:hypothetical protein